MSTTASALAALHRRLGIPPGYAAARSLRLQRETNIRHLCLVARAADDGQPVRLTPRAAAAWEKMRETAARDGLTLLPLSGFRSVRRQTQNIRRQLAAGGKISSILRLVAAPGYSEHHTGRALDIGSPSSLTLDGRFARTAEFRWLRRRASEFGFAMSYPRGNPHGFRPEPWHWCWHPTAH